MAGIGRRFYFTNENGDNIANDHIGNIRGARTVAQRIANERQEEITINDCRTDEMVDFIYPDTTTEDVEAVLKESEEADARAQTLIAELRSTTTNTNTTGQRAGKDTNMKYGYKEIRRISAQDLRNLCVRENWYTCGDNDEYGHLLLDLAGHKENITTDDIVEIASDIIEHSNLGINDFEEVAYQVANIAVVTIVPV